jgi:hypothetical protein
MGMYGTLRRAGTADVARLRANPELVEAFLFGEPPAMVDARPPGLLGFLLRFTPIRMQRVADPPSPRVDPPAWATAAEGEDVHLDKAWHGLHFLFTGTADGGEEPACFLLRGGEDLGEDDELLPRLLRPEQVRDFAAFLAALTPEELARRFDPERMTALEIYPDVLWQRSEETDAPLGFLLDAFESLRAFTATAATAGDAVVVCVA